MAFPSRGCRLLGDCGSAGLAQLPRSRLSALKAAQSPEGDGGGILAVIGGSRGRRVARRLIDDGLGELVHVTGALA